MGINKGHSYQLIQLIDKLYSLMHGMFCSWFCNLPLTFCLFGFFFYLNKDKIFKVRMLQLVAYKCKNSNKGQCH